MNTRISPSCRGAGLLGLLLLTASVLQGQVTTVFTFDDTNSMAGWWLNAWGGQSSRSAWDGTQNYPGNSGGSLHIFDTWQDGDQMVDMGWWGGQVWSDSHPIDLTTYQYVQFYLKWDLTNSTADLSVFQSTGEPLQLWAVPTSQGGSYPWIDLGPITIPWYASNNWATISVPINPAIPNISTAQGFGFKKYTGAGFTNTFAFWVDGIGYGRLPEPPPPPTLSIQTPVFGLNLVASGGPYNRESLRATNGPNSFVGHGSSPVTYSFTIKKGVEGSSGAQFQNHLFIIPTSGGPLPPSETSPDWIEPNCIFLDVESASNGQTVAFFRYKTNQPNTNAMLYDSRIIPAIITNAGLTGTWTLTVLNDTNFTLSTPQGGTTNFGIPPEAAQKFADPAYVYLGIQANNVPALGQWSVLSEAKVGGTATPFDDVFTNDVAIISNIWEIAAADPPGVMLVPGTSVFWVNWTLPDAGFDLVSGTTANPDNWMNESGVTIRQVGAKRWALIDQTNLPGSQGGYFALTRRQFTQLQVLLPGETNAPGTASGKIGLPTPVSLGAGGNISVTVNACDPQWNILNVYGDTIHVAATDTQATQPADTVLVTGITVQQFQLKTQGTTTFTASDTSDPSKTANTSTAVTVGP